MYKWIFLVALFLLPMCAHAQGKGALTPADNDEIRNLYARYSYGYDTGNPQMYADTFTPDGSFAIKGQIRCQGREQLVAFVPPFASGKPNLKHMPVNLMIEPSAEGAKAIAYVILVTFEVDKPPAVTGGGTYQDVLVKTANGWRFKRRNFTPFGPDVPPATP